MKFNNQSKLYFMFFFIFKNLNLNLKSKKYNKKQNTDKTLFFATFLCVKKWNLKSPHFYSQIRVTSNCKYQKKRRGVGAQALWIRFLLRGMKYLILIFFLSDKKTTEFSGQWGRGHVFMGTECLNARFPGFLCLLSVGYNIETKKNKI